MNYELFCNLKRGGAKKPPTPCDKQSLGGDYIVREKSG